MVWHQPTLCTVCHHAFLQTKAEGWEAFPTSKLMAAHYASEVKAQQSSQPLNRLLQQQLAGQLAGRSDGPSAADGHPSAPELSSSSSYDQSMYSDSVAGAHTYSNGSSSSRQYHARYHEHPGLPQSAPSATQRDILLMEPPQWLPDSYASHCGACQVARTA